MAHVISMLSIYHLFSKAAKGRGKGGKKPKGKPGAKDGLEEAKKWAGNRVRKPHRGDEILDYEADCS
jgi:hypothetical protein